MNDIISIDLNSFSDKVFFYNNKKEMTGIQSVNILIGPNNSGKSRFSRELFRKIHEPIFDYESCSISRIFSLMSEIRTGLSYYFQSNWRDNYFVIHRNFYTIDSADLDNFQNFTQFYSKEFLEALDTHVKNFSSLVTDIRNNTNAGIQFRYSGNMQNSSAYLGNIFLPDIPEKLNQFIEISRKARESLSKRATVYYIPSLRGLRPFSEANLYKERTASDYFKGISKGQEIITGLEFYDFLDEMLRGLHKSRIKVSEYENFLSENFFDKKEFNLVPKRGSDSIYVKVGDNEEHPISDFGDGLQNLIINTYHPFLNDEPSVYIFEEPDIFMHPGMQRKFLEVLSSKRLSHHRFFLTTHSNHMIDISSEYHKIAVFKFRKNYNEEGQRIDISKFCMEDKALLDDLGVRSSSALLANCAIWVEGISDRLYYKHMLKKFFEEKGLSHLLKDDLHYTFIEYNGGNLPHFLFDDTKMNLGFITPKSFFILDGDAKEKSGWESKILELNIQHAFLDCKEVECLIPEKSLVSFLNEKTLLVGIDKYLSYGSCFNKKSGSKFTSLAKLLNDVSSKNNISKKNAYFLYEASTFSNKARFANEIIPYLTELTPEMISICDQLEDFIKKSNGIE